MYFFFTNHNVIVQHHVWCCVVLQWNCSKEHSDSWTSSEVLVVQNNQKVHVNDVQMAAAIRLSGNNFMKFDLLAKFLGLRSVSESLYYRVQKLYCCPAVKNMWGQVKKSSARTFAFHWCDHCRGWKE